jgi:hypothetical protein
MPVWNILQTLGDILPLTIWYIFCSFGTFCVHLVHFFRFWYHVPRKIWQPWSVKTRTACVVVVLAAGNSIGLYFCVSPVFCPPKQKIQLTPSQFDDSNWIERTVRDTYKTNKQPKNALVTPPPPPNLETNANVSFSQSVLHCNSR